MSFHAQSFSSRHDQMGDIAENVFDTINGDRVHPLGLNRYWKNGKRLSLSSMTIPMRYTPDRMVGDAFVEVMGIGRDQTLKIKDEKLSALWQWRHLGPVELFVYDSHKERYWQAPLEDWWRAVRSYGQNAAFHDGKTYLALHVLHFPCSPTEVEPDG